MSENMKSSTTSEQIGDVKFVLNSAPDSKWLECNGAAISEDFYPDLVSLFKNSFASNNYSITTPWYNSNNYKSHTIIYADGYWVVGGMEYYSKAYHACIYYSTSLNGPWTRQSIWSHSSGNSNIIKSITYANGYWVVGGQYKSSGSNCYNARIAYATSLSGTWATKDFHYNNAYATCSVNHVDYIDGYFVAAVGVFGGYSYGYLYYATDPSGTWSVKSMWSYTSSYAGDSTAYYFNYLNGYYVGTGYYDTGSDGACIGYSTSLTGTYTVVKIGTDEIVTEIDYGNNYYGAISSNFIFYSSSLDGTWTYISAPNGKTLSGIKYINDLWIIICTDGTILYSTNIENNNWKTRASYEGTEYTNISIFSIEVIDNKIYLCGSSKKASDSSNGYATVIYQDGCRLPKISKGTTKAYIKAEDVEKFNITFNTASYCNIIYNDKSTNNGTLTSPFRIPVGDSIDFMATGTMNGYAWIYLNGNLVSQAGSNQLGCTYHFTPTSNINIVCETYKASVGTGRGGVIRITEL